MRKAHAPPQSPTSARPLNESREKQVTPGSWSFFNNYTPGKVLPMEAGVAHLPGHQVPSAVVGARTQGKVDLAAGLGHSS